MWGMLHNLDPNLTGGEYNTGLVTSRLPPMTFGNGRGKISLYGQINTAWINVQNGNPNGNNSYLSTNAASQNFFGANIGYKLNDNLEIGGRISIAAAYNRSDLKTDFSDNAGCDSRNPDRSFCLYDANFYLRSKTFGKFTIGAGETAYAGIGSITFGGTGFATNNDVNTIAGSHEVWGTGRMLNDIAPDVTGVTRGNLIRYNSPTLAGFVVSASWGEANHTGAPADADKFWDVALRYAGEFGGFRIAAGVGYQDHSRENQLNYNYHQTNLTGGGSIQHIPTGLFVAGSVTGIGRDAPFNPNIGESDRASAYYVQFGIGQNFFSIGRTTLYGEYGHTSSGADAGAYFLSDSKTSNWGLGVVQNIDAAAMSLYVNYKSIDADVGGVSGQNINVVMTGARIKF